MVDKGLFSEIYEDIDQKIIDIMKKILKNTIHLDPKRKTIVIKERFHCKGLSTKHKILIGLISVKAMNLEGWTESDEIKAKDLASMLGINYNTVRPVLRQLVEDGLIEARRHGSYAIKTSQIDRIYRDLSKVLERC